jgi:hypothetical protein
MVKGRRLLGVSVVAFVALGLVLSFKGAAFILALIFAVALWIWFATRFPLTGVFIAGFFNALFGRGFRRW